MYCHELKYRPVVTYNPEIGERHEKWGPFIHVSHFLHSQRKERRAPHTTAYPFWNMQPAPATQPGGPLFACLFNHQEDFSDPPTCVLIALIFSLLRKNGNLSNIDVVI